MYWSRLSPDTTARYCRMFLFLIFIFILSNKSFTQNKPGWIFAGRNKDGGETFIKSKVISTAGKTIKIWYMDVNEKLDSITNVHIQIMNLVEVDCISHKMKLDGAALYDSKGSLIFQHSYDEPWEKIITGTMKESILKKVCEVFGK